MIRPITFLLLGAIAAWCFGYALLAMTVPSRADSCPQRVSASWYGLESCANPKDCRTATGERYTGRALTAAMPSREYLGREYRVDLGKRSVVVRINDIGPAAWTGRGIDLSKAAAKKLGMIERGIATVCMERLS